MGPRLPRLFGFELAWAEAAFDTFFPAPPDSALVHGIKQMAPGAFLDDMLADIWLETSLGLRATLWIIALSPLFVLRRFATISSLEPKDRVRVLEGLLASPIYAVRQLVAGFKAMGSLRYAQSADIRKQMNTPPPALIETSSLVRVKAAEGHEHGEHAAE
jgi:hypothetical protein